MSEIDYKLWFNEVEYTPLRVAHIKDGLINRKLEPDTALIYSLLNAKTEKSLLVTALTMRYGANINTYVKLPGYSNNIHVIGYIYLLHKDNRNLLDIIISMALLSGSDLYKPIFDNTSGSIKTEKSLMEKTGQPVWEWLESIGYPLARDLLKGVENVYPKEKLPILLTLMGMGDGTGVSNQLIIKSLSDKLAENLEPSGLMDNWVDLDLQDSFRFLNDKAFETFIKAGRIPSYPLINDMLVQAGLYKRRKDTLGEEKSLRMIESVLDAGVNLDYHQIKLLTPLDPRLLQEITEKYKVPRWKKACSTKAELPVDVKRDMLGIDLDPTLDSCKVLESLYTRDKEEVKAAIIKKRSDQVYSDLRTINDYMGRNTPSRPTINNQSLLNHKASDYGDIYEVHYSDTNGNWSFTADMFDDLLETKENPITLHPLPQKVLDSISLRNKMLTDLGIKKPKTIEESFESLWTPDDITKKIDHDETCLVKLASKGVNISEPLLRKLKSRQVYDVLKGLNISNNIDRLEPSHAQTTLLWILNNVEPMLARTIIAELNITSY